MPTTILGIAHFTFDEGGLAEFQRLSAQCRQIVDAHDTGTLRYDIYIDEPRSKAVVIEEYESEQALVDHGRHIGDELAAAVLATGSVHGELLGDLSDDFRDQLRGGPVTVFLPASHPTTP